MNIENGVIKIFVTADNHLGFKDQDPIRKEDSYRGFHSALSIAQQEKADIVLILGDLFHLKNPSHSCIIKCIDIMKRKLGTCVDINDKLDLNYPEKVQLEPNSIPSFIIHGNHDMPNTLDNKGTIDLLDLTNCTNYIGYYQNKFSIHIEPVVVEKGDIKLAIYGMGFIDDFLFNAHLFHNTLTFKNTEHVDFRILMIHQNRCRCGKKNGCTYKKRVCPSNLPNNIFDLILWGNEHETYRDIEIDKASGLRIYQPGSTVQTSLAKSETHRKGVGILRFTKTDFKLNVFDIGFQRRLIYESFEYDTLIKILEKIHNDKMKEEYTDNGLISQDTKMRLKYFDESTLVEQTVNYFINKFSLGNTDGELPLFRARIFTNGQTKFDEDDLQYALSKYVANPE